MSQATVLFVDDQRSARDLFGRILDPERFRPVVSASVPEAEEKMRREGPDVIVTDLRMPDVDGLAGLERFRKIDSDVPVIVITAFGTVETAVEAMKRGAFDYIRKPFDPNELEIVIDRALRHRNLLRENARLRLEVERRYSDSSIICRAPVMREVMERVLRVAPTDCSVLILGESGTGKDLFARLIHQSSPRSKKPCISINCSAIPEHLLESELFGHEEGAFSGATTRRTGFFAEADGGTLFLDEIGDMSLSLQPKLLRVLENGEFYSVGSRRLTKTDVRLICASNRDIQQLVADGSFRQDLYYRINTVRIVLPPLRERTEDIHPLVEHFLAGLRESSAQAPTRVSADAMRCLLAYHWPGNVRELEHVIQVACVVCDGEEIQARDLPPEVCSEESPGAPCAGAADFKEARANFERTYFRQLLDETGGNVSRAAEIAGIHRTTLYDKLARLGIQFDKD